MTEGLGDRQAGLIKCLNKWCDRPGENSEVEDAATVGRTEEQQEERAEGGSGRNLPYCQGQFFCLFLYWCYNIVQGPSIIHVLNLRSGVLATSESNQQPHPTVTYNQHIISSKNIKSVKSFQVS